MNYIACQAPLSMGFSRQEYWSGLPFLSLGELSNPGIEPRSPTLQADALLTELLDAIYYQSLLIEGATKPPCLRRQSQISIPRLTVEFPNPNLSPLSPTLLLQL